MKEKEGLPRGYESQAELNFYGDDIDFMKFHKRTKQNMHETLQDLIESSKQTINKGVKEMKNVSVNYIDLNKASSLIIAYWNINTLPLQHLPKEIFENKAIQIQDKLKDLIEKDKQGVL